MTLVEQHTIRKGDKYYNILDLEAYKSKNLYNASLYAVRQNFFGNKTYLSYGTLQALFQNQKQPDYYALPAKVAQQTMKMVDRNFKSFFNSLKEYRKNPTKFLGVPRIPKYLDKKNGRYLLIYTQQAIGKKILEKEGLIKLSGIEVYIPTSIKYEAINQVRVVCRLNSYIVEIVYDDGVVNELKCDNGKYAAIDLGVSNLATLTTNINGFQPVIIDGKGLKSINRYYNKELSHYKSLLETRNGGRKYSQRTRKLTEKRNNKVKDYLHKASRAIVNQLVSAGVTTLIVGYNKNWKQDTNIGKVNNQNFVQIPYNTFVRMLDYKCMMEGIELIKVNESHTSKCSFMDMEEICHHDKYIGKRVHRGLFRCKDGKLINADVNGSYNILRKCKPEAFNADGVEGTLVCPRVIRILN